MQVSFGGSKIFAFLYGQLKLSQPNPDDLGYVDSVSVEEIGGARVCELSCASLTYLPQTSVLSTYFPIHTV